MKRNHRFWPVVLVLSLLLCSCSGAMAAVEDTGFSDVAAGAWYADAAQYVRDNGVMSGMSATAFSPDVTMTRAQAAVILENFLQENAVPQPTPEEHKTLVAYFSATGNTEQIARHLEHVLNADLYEIVPQQPYTADDLNDNRADSRAEQEINDPAARPAISGSVANMEDYDVAFIGYPIWWGQAPKIVSTFLERYDFSGKTIVPFCTSASSGIGGSLSAIQALAPEANWLSGQRFSGSATPPPPWPPGSSRRRCGRPCTTAPPTSAWARWKTP